MPPDHVFVSGLRLALPVAALMAIVDITLSLLGPDQPQPAADSFVHAAQDSASLATISALLMLFPLLYSEYAERTFRICETRAQSARTGKFPLQ